MTWHSKFLFSIKRLGPFGLFRYALQIPSKKYRIRSMTKSMLNSESIKDRFTFIFDQNYWGDNESKSGYGSSLAMTVSLRRELPKLIDLFEVKSIIDVPCGDFNWMKEVDLSHIRYTGGDIVKELIDKLQNEFSGDNVNFFEFDLTSNQIPCFDLVLIRDCLFHLSTLDILEVLSNFVKSKSKYLLTTSHLNNGDFVNREILSGDFRRLDLFSDPYFLPKEFLFEIVEEADELTPARSLYLWNHEQVSKALNQIRSK